MLAGRTSDRDFHVQDDQKGFGQLEIHLQDNGNLGMLITESLDLVLD